MFDLGIGEMMLIAVLVIVFVGPEGLPDMMRVLGRFYGKMRRASDDLRRTFNAEVARVDADRRREELRQRRVERERARAAAEPGGAEAPVAGSVAADTPPAAPIDAPEPDLLPPDPRLPPDAAPRAMPRPATNGPVTNGPARPRPPDPPREPEADAIRPPADPTEH